MNAEIVRPQDTALQTRRPVLIALSYFTRIPNPWRTYSHGNSL